jgi:hypothetical protein
MHPEPEVLQENRRPQSDAPNFRHPPKVHLLYARRRSILQAETDSLGRAGWAVP